jgi:DNA-binding MarR family transcriptional regulator
MRLPKETTVLSTSPAKSEGQNTPPESPALGEVLDFMRLLWDVDHELQSASKRMRTSVGVTGPQRLVIRVVARYPGVSAGDLARVLHLHPSTLTGVLRRLCSAHLLERRPDPTDARRALFHITNRADKISRSSAGTVEAAVRGALARVSPTKVSATEEVLGTIAEELRRYRRAS